MSTDGKWSEYGFLREHVVRVKEELERLGHVAVVCNRTDAGEPLRVLRLGMQCDWRGFGCGVPFQFCRIRCDGYGDAVFSGVQEWSACCGADSDRHVRCIALA